MRFEPGGRFELAGDKDPEDFVQHVARLITSDTNDDHTLREVSRQVGHYMESCAEGDQIRRDEVRGLVHRVLIGRRGEHDTPRVVGLRMTSVKAPFDAHLWIDEAV